MLIKSTPATALVKTMLHLNSKQTKLPTTDTKEHNSHPNALLVNKKTETVTTATSVAVKIIMREVVEWHRETGGGYPAGEGDSPNNLKAPSIRLW